MLPVLPAPPVCLLFARQSWDFKLNPIQGHGRKTQGLFCAFADFNLRVVARGLPMFFSAATRVSQKSFIPVNKSFLLISSSAL